MVTPVDRQPKEHRPEGQASLHVRLVFLAALVFAPLAFFSLRLVPTMVDLRHTLEALILVLGGAGFLGLIVWNALLHKVSFIALNTFLTCTIMFYLVLMLLLGK